MPVCKNTDRKQYTGNENTPLGKGFSASVEKVGTRKKGKDGKMYVVKKVKNGKRWAATQSSSKKVEKPRGDRHYTKDGKIYISSKGGKPGGNSKKIKNPKGDKPLEIDREHDFHFVPAHHFEADVQKIIRGKDAKSKEARENFGAYLDWYIKELRKLGARDGPITHQDQYDDWGEMLRRLYKDGYEANMQDIIDKRKEEYGAPLVSYATDGTKMDPVPYI